MSLVVESRVVFMFEQKHRAERGFFVMVQSDVHDTKIAKSDTKEKCTGNDTQISETQSNHNLYGHWHHRRRRRRRRGSLSLSLLCTQQSRLQRPRQ